MFPFRIFPILCNYHITTQCNARCVFCNIYKEKNRDAKITDVLHNLPHLKKLGVRFIDFTGGEPLLHPDLPKMLIAAKRLGFITTVTTNCILYPRRASDLKGLVDLLHFSMDGPTSQIHDGIRGVSCFEQVKESLSLAQKLGEKPDILFTVNDTNVNTIPDMVQIAQKLSLTLLINPVFSYFGNTGIGCRTINAILDVASQPHVYVNRGILRLMRMGGNQTSHPRCRAVATTVVISPENHLLLPCYHKAVKRIPIQGNLWYLFNSMEVHHLKKMEGRFTFCSGCAISCYFDPSFAYGFDDYFLLSQISKMKYTWDKYIRRRPSTSK